MPEFPGRKVFGSTNKSEEAIFERKKDLTNVINTPFLVCQRFAWDGETKSIRYNEKVLYSDLTRAT